MLQGLLGKNFMSYLVQNVYKLSTSRVSNIFSRVWHYNVVCKYFLCRIMPAFALIVVIDMPPKRPSIWGMNNFV